MKYRTVSESYERASGMHKYNKGWFHNNCIWVCYCLFISCVSRPDIEMTIIAVHKIRNGILNSHIYDVLCRWWWWCGGFMIFPYGKGFLGLLFSMTALEYGLTDRIKRLIVLFVLIHIVLFIKKIIITCISR